jgi:hypothetical protein
MTHTDNTIGSRLICIVVSNDILLSSILKPVEARNLLN